jgi:hypothetical protein
MSDDDDAYYPLFPTEDIERWKRRELPPIWLEQQKNILTARCRAQSEELNKMLASADEATTNRFNEPL